MSVTMCAKLLFSLTAQAAQSNDALRMRYLVRMHNNCNIGIIWALGFVMQLLSIAVALLM